MEVKKFKILKVLNILMVKKVELQKVRQPVKRNLKNVALYICKSLNLVENETDLELSMFLYLLKKTKYDNGASLRKISHKFNISLRRARRAIREFVNKDLARKSRNKYILRRSSVSNLIGDLANETLMLFRNIKKSSVYMDRKATETTINKVLEEIEKERSS